MHIRNQSSVAAALGCFSRSGGAQLGISSGRGSVESPAGCLRLLELGWIYISFIQASSADTCLELQSSRHVPGSQVRGGSQQRCLVAQGS